MVNTHSRVYRLLDEALCSYIALYYIGQTSHLLFNLSIHYALLNTLPGIIEHETTKQVEPYI